MTSAGFFAVTSKATVNTCIQFFCITLSLSSLKWMPRSTFLDLLIVACFGGFCFVFMKLQKSPEWLYHFTFATAVHEWSSFSASSPHLLASLYFIWAILIGVYVYLIVAWIWISLMVKDFGLLFMCLPSVSLQRNICLCLLFIL